MGLLDHAPLHAQVTNTLLFGPFVDYVLKALSAKHKDPYKKVYSPTINAATAKV